MCEVVSGALTASHETLDARWFGPAELPPLSPGHARRVADAIAFHQGVRPPTYFDP